MLRSKGYVLVKMGIAVLILLFVIGCGEKANGKKDAQGTEKATVEGSLMLPDFLLQDLEGREHRLSDYVGEKPLLLVFWSTGCPACLSEIPKLNHIYINRSKDLTLLSVDVLEPKRNVDRLVKARGVKYPVLLDPHGLTARDYRIRGVPTIVVIDLKGSMGYYGHYLPEALKRIDGLLS